jgi:hypothetical protein
MPTTYKLTVVASTNGYKPCILLQETNGSGTLKGATGVNLFYFGDFDMKFRPATLSIDFHSLSGRSLSLVYANIDTYSIWGTTTGLTTMHEIWDQIAQTASTAL